MTKVKSDLDTIEPQKSRVSLKATEVTIDLPFFLHGLPTWEFRLDALSDCVLGVNQRPESQDLTVSCDCTDFQPTA